MRLYYIVAFVLVIGLTVLSGLYQGQMRNRWGLSPGTLAAAQKLQQLPAQIGPWELIEPGELDEASQRILEPFGDVVGLYWNSETGARVHMSLILGPSGTIAVHTPDVCLSSQLYKPVGERRKNSFANVGVPENPHTFWAQSFKRTDVHGGLTPVYWAWTTGDSWEAAAGGRYKFASSPYLYKLQVSCLLMPGIGLSDSDPCVEFLTEFVPVAADYLVTPHGG